MFRFIPYWLIIALVFVAPVVIIIVEDWKAVIIAWLLQALAVTILLGTALPGNWALLHLMIAGLSAGMWLLSVRASGKPSNPAQMPFRYHAPRFTIRNQSRMTPLRRLPNTHTQALLSTIAPFRILAVLLMTILFQNYVGQIHLPNLEGSQATVALWLIAMGLLTVALTEDPLKSGAGLLTALAGFKLVYIAQEPAATTLLLLNIVELMIGFTMAYLIVAHALPAHADGGLADEDLEL